MRSLLRFQNQQSTYREYNQLASENLPYTVPDSFLFHQEKKFGINGLEGVPVLSGTALRDYLLLTPWPLFID